MTIPTGLKRKTRNSLLVKAKEIWSHPSLGSNSSDAIEVIHDGLMRAYCNGFDHGKMSERERRESSDVS